MRENDDFSALNRQLFLFPFPYKSSMTDKEREKIYDKYRKNIISKSDICIVINGTKEVGKQIVIADGVLSEVQIARDLGSLIIPIAATGGAAEQVWHEFSHKDNAYYQGENFKKLNNSKNENGIFNAIVDSIEKYTHETEQL